MPSPLNPFADDIVKEPRHIEPGVAGLNDHPLHVLMEEVEHLAAPPLPRPAQWLPQARLILSAAPGYGKSHLLGRLFQGLAGRATLVNVRPFRVPDTDWLAILGHTVTELGAPDRFADGRADAPLSQWQVFAHGVLSHLAGSVLADSSLKGTFAKVTLALQQNPLDTHQVARRYPSWPKVIATLLDTRLNNLLNGINRHCPGLQAKPSAWLRLLHTAAFGQPNPLLAESCLDWLKGEAIHEEHALALGLQPSDCPAADLSPAARNDLAKARLMDLCRLAGFCRPFLFCFDQTETYGDSKKLARAFGQLVQDLQQNLPNQLTVVTTNLEPWQRRIEPHWEKAALARLAPPLLLEELTRAQGEVLLHNRLAAAHQTASLPRLLKGGWLDTVFAQRPKIGVRTFLQSCRQRWDDLAYPTRPGPERTLAELFDTYVKNAAATPAKLRFDDTLLRWAAATALSRTGLLKNHDAQGELWWRRDKQDKGGLRIQPDRGNHWKHWLGVARAAHRAQQREGGQLLILRTPELPPIPPDSWQAAGPEIRQAMAAGALRVETPDLGLLATLLAAWDLHADAAAGNIPFTAKAVDAFLPDALHEWRVLLLATPQETATPAPVVTLPPTTQPPDDPLPSRIEAVFAAFKLKVAVTGRQEAPQLVRYFLRPAGGVTAVSLANRAADLMVHLQLSQPPVVGPAAGMVTLDIAKASPDPAPWSRWLADPGLERAGPLAFPVGVGVDNRLLIGNLADPNQCHLLVAGSTGSGKSVFLQALAATLMRRNAPQQLRLTIVDPKLLTFTALQGSPFLERPVVTTLEEAVACLEEAVEDMEKRYRLLHKEGLANLPQWHARGKCPLPYRLVLFDEFADLILVGGEGKKRFESLVARLAGKARAAGIHLVLATQRPDRQVVTGLIKANLPLKVCLRVANGVNSQIVLDQYGAESLLGKGDLLTNLGLSVQRGQSLFIDHAELAAVSG